MCFWYREESPVVLYEHQSDADDRRAVLDAHRLRAHVSPALLLKQVRPEDHGQVSGRHLVSGDLESRGRGGGDGGQSAVMEYAEVN